ncbi:MAG: flagellar biosynthesis protein FliQ [Lachnospiraceae bacterium]|nr:flagellar biosynthesis protein FliQ [Candidatus Merdinaster equi]
MTTEDVIMISRDALFTIVKTAAPVLLVSLIIGLTVSIFQTVTSIQEQSLTYIPKILGVFVCILLLGHWMLNNMSGLMTDLWGDFSVYVR